MKDMDFPKVSILIPTLNAGNVLENCLSSINIQNYTKDKIEIILADGGSQDSTLEIAKKYGVTVVENRLKTGEAGKAAALKVSEGEYVALVDSDNILPNENWLSQMIVPLLNNPEALGSEPWAYTWRKEDGFIDRYCALIGMNDPLVMFLGNYDRVNTLTGKWTEVVHEEEDKGGYLLVKLDKRGVPTIGANGTVFRADFLKKNVTGDYLFDIDIVAKEIGISGEIKFIKVKNGIIHNFCGSDIGKFARKQRRRVRDFLFHKNVKKDRVYDWQNLGTGGSFLGLIKFVLYCVLIFPLLVQVVVGYAKKRDCAWAFHPLACWLTLCEYGYGFIVSGLKKNELSRKGWGQ